MFNKVLTYLLTYFASRPGV